MIQDPAGLPTVECGVSRSPVLVRSGSDVFPSSCKSQLRRSCQEMAFHREPTSFPVPEKKVDR
jgi:hypothetical protein